MNETPAWLVYQRCVAAFAHDRYGSIDVNVQPNVFLAGSISGIRRQIDVLIDSRWGDGISKRIIVDAKLHKRKIDIKDVEAFESMMRDCQADHGVIVCISGYTDGALRRSQDTINITILPFNDAKKFDWVYTPCLVDHCFDNNAASFGMVLWGAHQLHGTHDGLWLIVQTGKCDRCHAFHVWCQDCGLRIVVPDECVVKCGCERWWASVPESKDSGHIGISSSVWLLMREDFNPEVLPTVIDRRPIR